MKEITGAATFVIGRNTVVVLMPRIVSATLMVMTLHRRYMQGVRLRIAVA